MQPFDEDAAALCKKMEEELNRTYRRLTGTVPFMAMTGAALNAHLDQVVTTRKHCKKMLDGLDLPCRDEVAALAKRMIKNESRLDELDENLYTTMQDLKQTHAKLSQFSAELAELSKDSGIN
jgi:septal ring factor EnvC (AmiA/AmiB activator)